MTSEQLRLADGSAVRLGERIGRGGEGEVFALADEPESAAKLYTIDRPAEREEKIAAMVTAGLAERSPLVAFPARTLREPSGAFAGFTMRRITGCKPLFELYAPGSRRRAFPGVDYRFLVRAAANSARTIAAVHEASCVIGDINHSGLLVSQAAVVALIDADSFQVEAGGKVFLCRVGVPEYTPPELQGRSLEGVLRTSDHDRFGLAVVVFQLLFMGRHPFSGAYGGGDMPLEQAIAEFRFAYSKARDTGMTAPPAVPSLDEWPPAIAAAFESAFGPEAPHTGRPSASTWIELLVALEQDLVACALDPLHFFPPQATECPWCRMERRQGISLFAPPPPDEAEEESAAQQGSLDLPRALAAINAVSPPPAAPSQPPGTTTVAIASPEARTARPVRRARIGGGVGLLLAAAILALAGVLPVLLCAVVGVAGLVALLVPDRATAILRRRGRAAWRDWDTALADWRERVSRERFEALKGSLLAAEAAYRALPAQEAQALADYRRNRRREQLNRFLTSFDLRTSRLRGVDDPLIATLASYGVETAADVNEWALLQVPGIGRKATWQIMSWRRRAEGQFHFSAQLNAADRAANAEILTDHARRRRRLATELAGGAERLERLRDDIVTRSTIPDPALIGLANAATQARADLALW